MTKMKTKIFADHELRILDLDGQDWFVANDLVNMLRIVGRGAYYAKINTIPSPMKLGLGRQPRLVNREGAKQLAALSGSYLRDAFQHWIDTGEEVLPDLRPWKLYLTNGLAVWAKCPEDALGPADSDGPVHEIDLTFQPDHPQVAPMKQALETTIEHINNGNGTVTKVTTITEVIRE